MGPQGEPGGGHRQRAYDVFVSHTSRQQDRAVADAIVARLEQAGMRCWMAPRDVVPGREYAEEIVNAITGSALMVVVVSAEANQSRHVHREVELAVSNDLPVIPFRTEPVQPTGAMAYFLESAHWLDAMTPPLDRHIGRLADVIAFTMERQAPRPPAAYPPAAGRAGPVPGQPLRGRRIWIAAAALALAGIAAGVVVLLLPSGKAPAPPRPRSVATTRLRAGNCLLVPRAYERSSASRRNFWTNTNIATPSVMTVVSCRVPHSGEVVFGGNAWPATMTYPGLHKIAGQAVSICYRRFLKYAGIPVSQSELGILPYIPIGAEWSSGDRTLICMAFYESGRNSRSSIRNSGR